MCTSVRIRIRNADSGKHAPFPDPLKSLWMPPPVCVKQKLVNCRVVIVVYLIFVFSASADVFVVKKNGDGFWALRVEKKDGAAEYVHRDTGRRGRLDASEIDGLIPTVQRGNKYDPDKVRERVDEIKRLRGKHGKLLRKLNRLLQEWQVLLRESPEFDGKIRKLVDEFNESGKDPKTYSRIALALGMLKYKDMRGEYTDDIESAIARVKKGFLDYNGKRFREIVEEKEMSFDKFAEAEYLKDELVRVAGDDASREFETLFSEYRESIYNASLEGAKQIFSARPSVDSYLKSRAILVFVRDSVAAGEDEQQDAAQRIESLVAKVSDTVNSYSFDYKGYPLSPEDLKLFRKNQDYASRIKFSSVTVREQCLIIPRESPGRVSVGSAFSVPLKLVFNCAQVPETVFGMTVLLTGVQGIESYTVRLPDLEIAAGHAEVTFTNDPSLIPESFRLARDAGGRVAVYPYLSRLRISPTGEEQWVPLSLCCGWPASP
ncbi:MAG: hypothetical protein R6V03_05090 [Kiritimatiellia bacterium]